MFMKVRVRWILLVFSSLLCVLCLGRSHSRAGTLSVDVSVDEVDVAPGDGVRGTSSGSCTLRAAVQESNALAGPDAIVLPSGSYVLALGPSGEDTTEWGIWTLPMT